MPAAVTRTALRLASFATLLSLSLAVARGGEQPATPPPAAPPAAAAAPQPEVDKLVYAKLSTNFGDIILELNNEKAPISVANFVRYLDKGAYDGSNFHRVVKDFVVQGGGFNGAANPIPTDEPIINESTNGLKNLRGTIAMARTNEPNSATSQFYFNLVDNSALDGADGHPGYAVFGKVIGGLAVIDAMADVPLLIQPQTGPTTPREPVRIEKAARIKAADAPAEAKAADASAEKGKAELKRRLDAVSPQAQFNDAIDFLKGKGIDTSKGVKTASGLWSVELEPGAGPTPTPTDVVKVHATGWLPTGKQIETTAEMGAPAEITLSNLPIKGLVEGLQLMNAGSRRYFIIPPDLAYGDRGGVKVPPDSAMVYEIQLVDFKHYDPMPEPEKQFDAALALLKNKGFDVEKGKKTDSGLWVLEITPGTGEQAKSTDNVRVNYNGWLVNDRKFDSSYDRGKPQEFYVNKVPAGLAQAVTTMKVGGKSCFIIPGNLAFGERGVPRAGVTPNAIVVYELELLSINNEAKGLPTADEAAADKAQFDAAMKFLKEKGVDTDKGIRSVTGLWYVDIVQGTGAGPQPDSNVKVRYSGWLTNGAPVDSAPEYNTSLTAVIAGWTEGIGSMRVGGKRYLVIPPGMAYGPNGRPPVVPGNSTLVFEVELLGINK